MVRKPVLTEDGSLTRFHPEYQEHYHSLSGARDEALQRFVIPCRLIERARAQGHLRFLDVGFGLGINVAVTLEEIERQVPGTRCEWVSLEKELLSLEELHSHWQEGEIAETLTALVTHHSVETDLWRGTLLLGDARDHWQNLGAPFDAIYLDPFSPSRNPEMWSVTVMRALWEVCAEGGILSTYSSAARVRLALMAAGWEIGLGPRVGRKSSGTVACRGALSPPLEALEEKQRRSLERRLKEQTGKDSCDPPIPPDPSSSSFSP